MWYIVMFTFQVRAEGEGGGLFLNPNLDEA